MNFDVQVWTEFLKENWLVIVVALVILFFVLNFVKTVVKWVLVLVIAAAVVVYSGITMNDIGKAVETVKEQGVNGVLEQAVNASKDEVMKMMKNEAKEAKLVQNPEDGSYTITTPNLEVTGEAGKDKVKVSLRGVPLGEWSINETVEAFITEAANNAK